MARYSALLDKAVEAIVHTFKKRAIAGLLSGRSGRLVGQDRQARSQEQFELIIPNPTKIMYYRSI
jgi:hypothetical protein